MIQTYNEILERMCDKYEERVGTRPDKASDIGIRMEVLAGEIFSAQTEMNWIKTQMFPQTATGEYLDLHAAQRGITRKTGTKAVGEVTFTLLRILDYEIEIPKGTVCATSGENPVRFITTEDITVLAGRKETNAAVEALEVGADGNVSIGEINVIVTPIAELSAVYNYYRIEDGSDIESDEELRRRVLDSYVNISNGTNKIFYINSAMEIDGVRTVGVVPGNRGMGTVDVFIMSYDGEPSDELISKVQNHLDSLREINVDIKVAALHKSSLSVYVTVGVKSGYEFSDVRVRCETAIYDYFSQLDAGETVYFSEIGEFIRHVEGVENYTFVKTYSNDLTVSPDYVAVPGVIWVMERVEQ